MGSVQESKQSQVSGGGGDGAEPTFETRPSSHSDCQAVSLNLLGAGYVLQAVVPLHEPIAGL